MVRNLMSDYCDTIVAREPAANQVVLLTEADGEGHDTVRHLSRPLEGGQPRMLSWDEGPCHLVPGRARPANSGLQLVIAAGHCLMPREARTTR